jgi:hypothetical protein
MSLDKLSGLFIPVILFVQAFVRPKSTTALYNLSGMQMLALGDTTI